MKEDHSKKKNASDHFQTMSLALLKCAKFRIEEFHRLNNFSNRVILKGPKLFQIPEANSRGS
jgi:hypothetical protein